MYKRPSNSNVSLSITVSQKNVATCNVGTFSVQNTELPISNQSLALHLKYNLFSKLEKKYKNNEHYQTAKLILQSVMVEESIR